MTDRELVRYIRENAPRCGLSAAKAHLLDDGVEPLEVEAAAAEVSGRGRGPAGRLALLALAACAALGASGLIRLPARPSSAAAPGGLFRGRGGFTLAVPPGYEASRAADFPRPGAETVYLFPKGTDPDYLRNQGLYADLDILRLEASPRRVPRGREGTGPLKADAARALVAPADEPYRLLMGRLVGERFTYTLTGGEGSKVFEKVLKSIREE